MYSSRQVVSDFEWERRSLRTALNCINTKLANTHCFRRLKFNLKTPSQSHFQIRKCKMLKLNFNLDY